MTSQELNTKIKILQVAHKLFAEKGKNGVAIREIAKEADVNVAAINYHFGNKDSLYGQTIKASMLKMHTGIALLYQDNCSVEELISRIFDYFIQNREDLITGFNIAFNVSTICL
jgi:AcrR family transcriptional regulator